MRDGSRWIATFSALVFFFSASLPLSVLASPLKGGLSPTGTAANQSLSAANRITLAGGSTVRLPSLAPPLPVSVAKTGGLVFAGDPTLPALFNLNLASVTAAYKANISQPEQIYVGGVVSRSGIVRGGTAETVTPGELLTPAQYVALGQIAATGHQSLVLSASGAASSGFLTLDPQDVSGLSGLYVPSGVRLNSIGFTQADPFDVSGSAVVNGSLYSLQQAKGAVSQLDFASLTVGAGGLVTDSLPRGTALFANLFSGSGMTIEVSGDLHNSGTISSGGALTLSAGGGIYNDGAASVISAATVNLSSTSGTFANAGLIAASTGNVNFATQADNDITLENSDGTVSALSGSVNFRDASYGGPGNLTISGGNLLADSINLYSGQGNINLVSDTVQGVVNVYGGMAHLVTATNDLQLGVMDVSGDPLFYNQQVAGIGGDVTIEGNLIFSGESLAIVAGGNIQVGTSSVVIETNGAAGTTADGGNIYLVAGANISNCSSGCNIIDPLPPTLPAPAGTTISVNGASATGGSIELGNVSLISTNGRASTTSSGGQVMMVAFAGGSGVGAVNAANTTITTGGNLGGSNGNVVIIAGATGGAAVSLGTVTTTGGTAASTGNVSIYTAQPTTSDTNVVIFDSTGSITSGNTFVASSQLQPSSVFLGGSVTAAGTLTIQAGGLAGTAAIARETVGASLQAANINLSTTAGDVGSSSLPLLVQASNTVTANSAGNVYLDATGNITLGSFSAGTNFQLNDAGSTVTIGGNVSAGTAAGDFVNITAGSILESSGGGGTVSGAIVFLESTTGGIGTDPSNFGTPIYVRAGQTLNVDAFSNAYVSQDNSALSTTSLSLMVTATPAAAIYLATTGQGSITLDAALSADKVTLINTNGSINTATFQVLGTTSVNLTAENGDITTGIGGDITASNGSVTLTASGVSIASESTVQAPAVTISTPTLALTGQIVATGGALTLQPDGSGLSVSGPGGTLTSMSGVVNFNAPGHAVYVNINNVVGEVTGSASAISLTVNNAVSPLTVGMLTTSGGDISIVSFANNIVLNGNLNTAGGNVLIVASGGSFGTIAPASGVSVITGGGNVAMVAGSTINGAGNSFSINTTQATGQAGSVYLSSGYTGGGDAIDVLALMIGSGASGGTLLATAAHNTGTDTIVVTSSQWLPGPLNVSSGAIVSAAIPAQYSVLPSAFNNNNGTLNPGQIPGGGFASFTNTSTLTLQDDPNSGMSFGYLVPIVVNTGTAMSLGTITDNYPNNTAANFIMVVPAVSISGSIASVQVGGTLKFISSGISVAQSLSLTGNGVVIESPINFPDANSTIDISTNSGGSADIVLAALVSANLSNSSITVTTYQSGNIIESGGLLEAQAGQVTLQTEYGNIGSPVQPIQINAGTLSVTTSNTGSAFIFSSQPETLNVQAQVGGTFQLSSSSPVIVDAAINAGSVVVSSAGLDVQYPVSGTNGVVFSSSAGMAINDTITATNGAIMLTAGGQISAAAAVQGTSVTVQNTSGNITTGMLTSTGGDVSVVSLAGNVNLNGSITTNGGNVLIVDNIPPCCEVVVSTTITIDSVITTNGGNVAMVANTSITGGSINTTSAGVGGSVYLSSGGTISVTGLGLGGGLLLATTDTSSGLAVTPTQWTGSSLSMPNGAIYASNAAVSTPITVLPAAFSNSGTTSISPAQIPGGGFYSFSNTGMVTLVDDPKSGSGTPMFSFAYLVPLVVASSVSSLGTVTDNTSTQSANLTMAAPAIVTGTSNAMVQVGGSIKFFSSEIDLSNPAGVFTLSSGNGSINTETAAIYGSGYTVQFTGNTVVIGSAISNAGGTINFNPSIQGMMNVYGGSTSNLQAATVNFSNSDGCVSANLNSISGTVSATVGGESASFSLTTQIGNLSLGAISASMGNVTITANGGDIALGGAVSGSPTTGQVSLTAAGNIEGPGLVSGSTVSLTAALGSIDASGTGAGTPVNTATENLQLSATNGSAYINNTTSNSATLMLNGSNISVLNTLNVASNNGIVTSTEEIYAGVVSLSGSSITVACGAGVEATAGNVSLTATGGDIDLHDDVTSTNGDATLNANGTICLNGNVSASGKACLSGAQIMEGANGGEVFGNTVSLISTNGDIGTDPNNGGTPVYTAATEELSLSSSGNAYVSQDNTNANAAGESFVTLTSSVPGTLNVSANTSNGSNVDLDIGSPFSTANVIIINNNAGGINVGSATVTGTSSVTLMTMNGNITAGSQACIAGSQVSLSACEGTIGVAPAGSVPAQRVNTAAGTTLTLNGDDGVYVYQTGSVNLGQSGTYGSTFDLLMSSDSSVTITGAVGTVGSGTVNITASGSGGILQGAGNNAIAGSMVNLEAGSGNMGSDPSVPGNLVLQVQAGTLTANTSGNVFIEQAANSNDLTLGTSSAGSKFEVDTVAGSGYNIMINGGVTVSTDGTISLTADGSINECSGTLTGGTVNLTATQGNIGENKTILTSAGVMALNAPDGSAYVSNDQTFSLNAANTSVANTLNVTASNGDSSTSGSGAIGGTIISLTASSGNVTIGANAGVGNSGTTSVMLSGNNISGTGLVEGTAVSLTANGGSIDASGTGAGTSVNTAAGSLTVSATGGNAYVSNNQALTLTAANTNVADTLSVTTTAGNLSTGGTGAIGGASISFKSNAGNVILGANAGVGGSGTTSVSLTGDNISGTALVEGTTVSLTANGGSIDASGTGAGTAVNTAAGSLILSATNGSAYVSNNQTLSLSAANIDVSNTLQITVTTGNLSTTGTGAIGGTSITLIASAGSVTINATAGVGTGATTFVKLQGDSIGGAGTVQGASLKLAATTGDIGTSSIGGAFNTAVGSGVLMASADNGSVYIEQNGNLNLGLSQAGSIFQLSTTAGSDDNITIMNDVTVNSNSGTINLTADGSIIEQTGVLTGSNVYLTGTQGAIGSNPAIAGGTRVNTAANNVLTANAAGDVYINQNDQTGAGVILGTSAAGNSNTFDLTTGTSVGGIAISGQVSAATINLTTSGSLGIQQGSGGLISATTANLNTTSDFIGSDPTAGGLRLETAVTDLSVNSTGGSAFIDNAGCVVLEPSNVGTGTFDVQTKAGSNGGFTIDGNISAGTIKLTADGSGDYKQDNGVLTAATVTLTSTSGAIGSDPGNGGVAINTAAGTLTATTSSNVYINQIGAVDMKNSYAGGGNTFQLTSSASAANDGTITVDGGLASPSGTIGTVSLTVASGSSGAIIINTGNITASSVTLSTDSANISTASGSTISAGTIVLESNTGDFGTNPAVTGGMALSTTCSGSVTANTGGNVFIANTGTVSLGHSSAGTTSGLFQFINDGPTVTVSGAVTGSVVAIQGAFDSDGGVVLSANIMVGNTYGNDIVIAADGTGTITTTGGTLTGNAVTLISGAGDIGSDPTNSGTAISTQAGLLTATTSGNVYIAQSGTVTVFDSSAGSGKVFYMTNSVNGGDIDVSGTLTAGSITLIANNGGINIGSSQVTAGANLTLMTMNGNLTSGPTGLASGGVVTLNACESDIGNSASQRFNVTSTQSLTMQSDDDLFVQHIGTVNLLGSSAGNSNTFDLLVTGGDLQVNGGVEASKVVLAVTDSHNIVQVSGTVSGTKSVSLSAVTGMIGSPGSLLTTYVQVKTTSLATQPVITVPPTTVFVNCTGCPVPTPSGNTSTPIVVEHEFTSTDENTSGNTPGSTPAEQNATKIATDTTPQSAEASSLNGTGGNTANVPPESKSDLKEGISGTSVDTGHFDSKTIANLRANGVDIGEGSNNNFVVLNRGNLLFQPNSDIAVHVQEGTVFIPNGAMAFVIETGHDLAVYDMHDGHHGAVKVQVGKKLITLTPGKQLVLTRQLAADFDHVNPGPRIAYRGVRGEVVAEGIKAYAADFSIPSIMMNVGPLKRMLASDIPSERRAAHKLLKNAVILAQMSGQAGPYQSPTPAAPVQP